MSKKVYIIRHGQTEYNAKGMVQGSGIDASLNDLGRAQARAFFDKYQGVPFQKIFVSRLIRTKETVQGFIDKGIPFEVVPGLEEISWGSQEGVPFTPETSTIYQQTTERWAQGEVDLKIDGGETPVEVAERQKLAIDFILDQPEDLILICTHGRAMRILLSWLTEQPLSSMDQFSHANTGLYVLDYTDGKWTIELANSIDHLSALD